jgi:nucleoredoxin
MAAEQSSILDLFGGDCQILTKNGLVQLSTLAGKYVGVYFSAHWCPPCRGFTPKLAEYYQKAKDAGKDWEIIFVSSDRDQSSFDEYYAEMPWCALPFSNRALKQTLGGKFKVSGIPAFFLVNPEGEVYNDKGRGVVQKPIADFPWLPPTMAEVFTNDLALVDKNGNESTFGDTQGKYVGVYVSAHWCPPCRAFTPVLSQRYQKAQAEGKDFEIVFSSWDKDETQFNEYLSEMPWKAIKYSNEATRDNVGELFGVEGIPCLIILNNTGEAPEIYRDNAVSAVRKDENLVEFPWPQKPVNDLAEDFSGIDELPALILLQNNSVARQQETTGFLEVIGQEQLALGKKRAHNCYTGNTSCNILNRVRDLTGVRADKMIILDLQDNGAYYETDLPSSLQDVRNFVTGYANKSITRKQCSR